MCHNCTKNDRINRIHERYLRLIYNEKKSFSENLLNKDSSASIHHKHLRSLAIKIFKVHRDILPEILNDLFPLRQVDQHSLRNKSRFFIPNVKTVNYGFESLRYL